MPVNPIRRNRSIYAELRRSIEHRARFTPRVDRKWRPRVIAWAGPTAFYNNRFYNLDKWYKARIVKPDIVPDCYIIDPDEIQMSLEERLADPDTINIGFKKREFPTNVFELDQMTAGIAAIQDKLKIDVNKVRFNSHYVLARHYGIFKDLFVPRVYFENTQELSVLYGDNEVFSGNLICSSHAIEKPNVKIESLNNKEAFNTLFMVNLDGDFFEPELDEEEKLDSRIKLPDGTQMLQWLVGNIPNGEDLSKGEEFVPYTQPIPLKGTGYHRIAFVLYRHKEKIDFSQLKLKSDHLSERVFKMNRFYKNNEDKITPSALKFCQMKWHESCAQTLNNLGMKIPRYHYEWDKPYNLTPQREFPEKSQPFNFYLDKFRSREEINKEMKSRRLERLVREGKVEKSKIPDPFYTKNRVHLSPWVHSNVIMENVGLGKYALLYNPDPINAAEQAELEAAGQLDPHSPAFEKAALEKL